MKEIECLGLHPLGTDLKRQSFRLMIWQDVLSRDMCAYIRKQVEKAGLQGEKVPLNMFATEASAHPTGTPEEEMVCRVQCQVRQELAFVFLYHLVDGMFTERGYDLGQTTLGLLVIPSVHCQQPIFSEDSVQWPRKAFQYPLHQAVTFFCCRFRDTLLLFACVIKVLLSYTINFDDCQCQEKGCMNMFIFLQIWLSEQRVLAPGSKDD